MTASFTVSVGSLDSWSPPASATVTLDVVAVGVVVELGDVEELVEVLAELLAAVTVTVAAVALVDATNAVGSVGVNTAVIAWLPTALNDVVAVAEPEVTVAAEPIAVPPSSNCTLPTALPGDTVADSATLAPAATEDGEAATVVVVATAAAVTVTVVAELVEAVNDDEFAGVNTAVIACEPTELNEVEALAVPPLTVTAAPIAVLPSSNWTVPAAVLGDTVADSATLAPVATDVGEAETVVAVWVAPVGAAVTVTVAAVALVDATNAVGSDGVKTAVIGWLPTELNDVVAPAVPPVTVAAEPIAVPPSSNWTLPTALLGDTVADRATLAPAATDEGVADTVVVVATAGAVTVTVAAVALVDAVNAVASVGVNDAVIECVPALANEVEALAVPPLTVTAEPIAVPPSSNWMLPTAVLGDTVADSDTVAPVAAEVGEADTVVVVCVAPEAAAVTVTVAAVALVDAVNALAFVGVNTAVIEWVPVELNEVVAPAVPPDTVTAEPIAVPPSLNCTVPAAVLGDTVADSETLAPVTTDDGLADTVVVVAAAAPVTVTVAAVALVDDVNEVGSVGVNTAVIECVPVEVNEVEELAVPPLTVTAEPIAVPPSSNCTCRPRCWATPSPTTTRSPQWPPMSATPTPWWSSASPCWWRARDRPESRCRRWCRP